jgi:drug/metabolite transporter (DMT)-like permease
MWSLSFPLIKSALVNGVPPITLAAMRTFVFVPTIVFLFVKYGKKCVPNNRDDWMIFIGIGLFSIILPGIFQNIGMTYTTASISSILQSSGPVFTILLAILFLKESKGTKKIVGSTIALTGTILLVLSRNGDLTFSESTVYGNTLVLISGISYAISSIITKKGLERLKPLQILGFSSLIGFLVLSAISIFEQPQDIITNLSNEVWITILLLVLFPSFIAILFWYEAMINEEVSRLIVFIYLMPVFAVIFSYISLGEIISIQSILLAALIIGGIALSQRNSI